MDEVSDEEEASKPPPVDIQAVRRRGGVSAEPLNEDDLGGYVKKV